VTDLPEVDPLELELVQLGRRCDDLRRRHERVKERVLAFPSEHGRAEERAIASRLAAMELGMRLLAAKVAERA
jgi:hypothetical protein